MRDRAARIERGDWPKVVSELRDIAGETLATERAVPSRQTFAVISSGA